PDPVGVVDQTVHQVSQAAGVPVPTATPTATPAPAPTGSKTGRLPAPAPKPAAKPARQSQGRVLATHQARTVAPTVALASLQLGGLRSSAAVPQVTDPVVAPAQTAVLAAGQSPALAPRPMGAGL